MRNIVMNLLSIIDATITLGDWLVLTPQIITWIIIVGSSLIGVILIVVLTIIIMKKRNKRITEVDKSEDEEEVDAIDTPDTTVSIHTTLRVVEIIGTIKQNEDKIMLYANDGSTYNLHTIAPWESQDTLKDSEDLRENIGKEVEIIGDSDGNAIWKVRVNRIVK